MQERGFRLTSRTPLALACSVAGDHEILAGLMTTCRCVPAAGHDLLIPSGRLAGLRLAAAIGAEQVLPGRSGQPFQCLLEADDRTLAFVRVSCRLSTTASMIFRPRPCSAIAGTASPVRTTGPMA